LVPDRPGTLSGTKAWIEDGEMRGIVLAGGAGTRLHPVTQAISKQLLPVYDKPMIYYPLSLLMLSGIKDVLVISTPQDTPRFELLLEDGAQWGINISYAIQPSPDGFGDNVFYGHDLSSSLRRAASRYKGATVFAYPVQDPQRYGVVEFNDEGRAISLEEKPDTPKSNYAVTGLYFYDNRVIDIAKQIKPSARGELEITDVNNQYLQCNDLSVEVLGRGMAWLDMGTHDSLLQASLFIETIENRQGLKVACLEEIAYRQGFIGEQELEKSIQKYRNSNYGKYLENLLRTG
jgi:glucose-1-phosphate thymidylyltransferase